MMASGRFTDEERRYLRSLAAVSRVTETRITYTMAFREECMRRYWNGESSTKIFREAGLGPEIIGHKRIERCIARWRNDGVASGAHNDYRHRSMTSGVENESQLRQRVKEDERIIVLQARRIQALEDQLNQLHADYRKLRRAGLSGRSIHTDMLDQDSDAGTGAERAS
ncbi:HTH domain-containing protein [Bifidobacterium olomucense]|uniref:Methyltransferase n=1 Tax=Bifidobacterium olomucense TaxID=2675324 RepID=A0A7Y0HX84_9BIFI|nr:HTH domain-containing protein [Bifidobacterium sp. DSM 109959]NMM97699.1 methyltransferase [Bifidobacterium sp. DSM 109959]